MSGPIPRRVGGRGGRWDGRGKRDDGDGGFLWSLAGCSCLQGWMGASASWFLFFFPPFESSFGFCFCFFQARELVGRGIKDYSTG